jgi:hypothetical protein
LTSMALESHICSSEYRIPARPFPVFYSNR